MLIKKKKIGKGLLMTRNEELLVSSRRIKGFVLSNQYFSRYPENCEEITRTQIWWTCIFESVSHLGHQQEPFNNRNNSNLRIPTLWWCVGRYAVSGTSDSTECLAIPTVSMFAQIGDKTGVMTESYSCQFVDHEGRGYATRLVDHLYIQNIGRNGTYL